MELQEIIDKKRKIGNTSLIREHLDFTKKTLERFDYDKTAVTRMLQEVQKKYNFVPREVILFLSQELAVPLTKIDGIVNFYKMFRLEPKGERHICVCDGTACHVKGAENILEIIEIETGLKPGQRTKDNSFSLQTVGCIGCCALAPVAVINDETFGKLTPHEIKKIIKDPKNIK